MRAFSSTPLRRPRPFLAGAPTLLALCAALACAANSPEATDAQGESPSAAGTLAALPGQQSEWSGRIDDDAKVGLYTVNGDLRVETSQDGQVHVRAEASGRDAEHFELRVVETRDGLVICAVEPGGRCDARGYHGPKGRTESRGQMDLTLSLPAGADLEAQTVNGSVETRGVSGHQEVHTVNGDLDIASHRGGSAETVNGTIDIAVTGALSAALDLRTVNGRIELRVDASTAADLEAQTVNGSIHTELPLSVSKQVVGSRAKGKLGGGGHSIRMETVNGSIDIEGGARAESVPVRTVDETPELAPDSNPAPSENEDDDDVDVDVDDEARPAALGATYRASAPVVM